MAHPLSLAFLTVGDVGPVEAVRVLEDTVRLEMDLRMEAAAVSEMAENVANDEGFRVPRVDWTRSALRIMTQEWIDGIKLSDHEALKAAGYANSHNVSAGFEGAVGPDREVRAFDIDPGIGLPAVRAVGVLVVGAMRQRAVHRAGLHGAVHGLDFDVAVHGLDGVELHAARHLELDRPAPVRPALHQVRRLAPAVEAAGERDVLGAHARRD